MKTTHGTLNLIVAVFLGVSAAWVAAETELASGDPAEKVIATLGEPKGYLKAGGLEVYIYDRGRVEVRDGLVSSVGLVTVEEAVVRRMEQARQQAEQAMQHAALIEDGRRLRDERLADPAFAALPIADRLAYWQSFVQRYPGVGAEDDVARLTLEQQREMEWAHVQWQVADLEHRTRQAEERARQAEQDAAAARRQNALVVTSYAPPPVVYYYPSTAGHGGRHGYVLPPYAHGHRSGTQISLTASGGSLRRDVSIFPHPLSYPSVTSRGRNQLGAPLSPAGCPDGPFRRPSFAITYHRNR